MDPSLLAQLADPAILAQFSNFCVSQSATSIPPPPSMHQARSSEAPPAQTGAGPDDKKFESTRMPASKKKNAEDKTPPHSWTHEQKEFLLEQISKCILLGLATDNGNLNKNGWAHVMTHLNERFDLALNRDQIKNLKNKLRDLYVDTKFLRDQSGFGWDPENDTVTADSKTWEELIKAHPRRGFGKLMGKSFPFYDLAHQVFSGTFATGEMAAEEMLGLTIPSAANETPPSTARKTKKKRLSAPVSSDDDNKGAPVAKRSRESKNEVITRTLGGLTTALEKLTAPKSEHTNTNPTGTPSEMAIELCTSMFSTNVSDDTLIEFVIVLEHEAKARTFLTLSRTSTPVICKKWLDREVCRSSAI